VSQRSLPLGRAVVLGLLHGPAERLPISSSGHTALVPWLRGWDYDALDPAVRKRFEVALHGGAVLGLLVLMRGELALAGLGGRRLAMILAATAPAALAGLALERPIERRLGRPGSIAASLLAGSVAMAAAERFGGDTRVSGEATAGDGLALGAAQALALIPGVSRSGVVRAAARARGFARADADRLALELGLPVTLGALALKARELSQADREEWQSLAAGALASFAATLTCGSLVRRAGSLVPYAAYRTALAAAVLRRLRQTRAR
jgi:undecaprenyl-diphosphatase